MKSPAACVDISPGQKKLKQARLPFKIISDVSPKPEAKPSRKRKISNSQNEVASKVGRLSKENDVTEDSIVVSDEDSKCEEKSDVDKVINPYVKIVKMAIKKKTKSKTKTRKSSRCANKSKSEEEIHKEQNNSDIEMVDLDDSEKQTPKQEAKPTDNRKSNSKKTPKTSPKSKSKNIKKSLFKSDSVVDDSEVIVLDDNSNSSPSKQNPKAQKTPVKSKSPINGDIKDKKQSPSTLKGKDNSNDEENNQSLNNNTPKKSVEKSSLNKSLNSSKVDTSVSSSPVTPSNTKRNSLRQNSNEASTPLTPKQLQRKLESAKKREEKEKEKQERELKRQEEKDERDRIKREKEEAKKKEREEKEEARKREKAEKEDAKRKEKEEKDRQRELEKKQREEKEEQKKREKEEKEEQRKKEKEAREDEKRKRQEAAELEKQEAEIKKKKAAEAFVNFFVPKQKVDKTTVCTNNNDLLSTFCVKSDMRLAPLVRSDLTEERREVLDSVMKEQNLDKSKLYVKLLVNGIKKAESCDKTWPLSERDDDVVIVEDELPPVDGVGEVLDCESVIREKLRPKLLSFHENRRPPYWGTWRKKSAFIKPRKPFGQDEKSLDYEVDSDDEWEEEQEGESIDGSAAGSDAEPEDDYEVDNDVFVPHGYLSDEEGTMDGEDMLSLTPEAQKARLKHLEDEFESEMKKPTEKLKPRLYGLIWENSEGGKPDRCVDALWNYFGKLSMLITDPTPLLTPTIDTEDGEKKKTKRKKVKEEGESSPRPEKKKKTTVVKEDKIKKKEKATPEPKKNQLGINSFLKKLKSP